MEGGGDLPRNALNWRCACIEKRAVGCTMLRPRQGKGLRKTEALHKEPSARVLCLRTIFVVCEVWERSASPTEETIKPLYAYCSHPQAFSGCPTQDSLCQSIHQKARQPHNWQCAHSTIMWQFLPYYVRRHTTPARLHSSRKLIDDIRNAPTPVGRWAIRKQPRHFTVQGNAHAAPYFVRPESALPGCGD
jgi:hypothetical protein